MLLLDTNILSELRRPHKAHPLVLQWANQVRVQNMYISVISILEIEMGILRVQRHDVAQSKILLDWLECQILPQFQGRILEVNVTIARRCAALHIPNPQAERDALIAATALIHNMTVVTRNTKDFVATGVLLFNPFDEERY
jgi:hypothetical protein